MHVTRKPSRLGMFALFVLFLQPIPGLSDETVELVEYMRRLQYFTHKAGLAIEAKNEPLTHFYLHELEEVIDKLKSVEVYDGHPIAALAQRILKPAFKNVEKGVEAKQFDQTRTAYGAMLTACNQCHQATAHGYIKIEKRLDNPFMQSFAP
jgi:hypothetical protein